MPVIKNYCGQRANLLVQYDLPESLFLTFIRKDIEVLVAIILHKLTYTIKNILFHNDKIKVQNNVQ